MLIHAEAQGLGLTAAGVAAAALHLRGLYIARTSRGWNRVAGHVRSAMLDELPRGGEVADVRYSYQVRGHTHTGSRIRFGWGGGSLAEADDVNVYRQFRDVTVYVNPDDADDAVLEPGPMPSQWIGLAISLALVAIGCWRLIAP